MAIIVPPDVMERCGALAEPLMATAYEAAEGLSDIAKDATADEIERARLVQATIIAIQALLHHAPLNQAGVVVAMGAVSGTVLGQCEGDLVLLYDMFRRQMAATVGEVRAGRLAPQGTA